MGNAVGMRNFLSAVHTMMSLSLWVLESFKKLSELLCSLLIYVKYLQFIEKYSF